MNELSQCALGAVALLAFACAPASSSHNDASADHANDAATDAAERDACAMGAARDELAWADGPAYPRAVDHHGTWIFEHDGIATLYVAGGIRQGAGESLEAVYNQVSRADIRADGTLGEWTEDTPLPVPTGFHGIATVGGRVYLAGGLSGSAMSPQLSRRVFVGERGPGGALAWRELSALPWSALHPSLTALDNTLVLVGGTNGQTAQNAVGAATLLADGSISEWTHGANTPEPRSHHYAFAMDGQLYLAGGFRGMPVGNRTTPLPAILRSVRDASGAITAWSEVGSMDPVRSTHAGFVLDRFLYIIGGITEQGDIREVQRAPLACDGTVGAFADVRGTLPFARSHVHQTPVFNGRVYSVAGRGNDGVSLARTIIGALR